MTVSGAGSLIAARAVLGVAAAILTPITLAILPVLFTPQERPRALAITMMAAGLGVPLGPLVGGLLLEHFWWGSIFLVNVPIAVIALIAVAVLIPESRDPQPRPIDWLGGVLSTVGLLGIVYAVIEQPSHGWSDRTVLGCLFGGLAVLAVFVLWQRQAAGRPGRLPMIDLRLFANRRFLWGSLCATVASFALYGLLFALPQYLQVVRGNTAFGTGLRLLPMMAGLIVGARFGEVAARRWGSKVGAGTGTALTPAMDAVLGALPPARVGSGSALTMAFRQVGGAFGVAILGSILAGAYTAHLHLPSGVAPAAASSAKESVAAASAVAVATHNAPIAQAGTKEDVVLRDEYDDVLIEAFRREPPDRKTVAAMRHAVSTSLADLGADDWKTLRERTVLIMATPALRMRQLDDFADLYREFASAIADRIGRDADDLECRAVAGAVLGVCSAVAFRWIDGKGSSDLAADLDRGLADLDTGFTI